MHLINDNVFVDLTPHVDINRLQEIEKDIIIGIVKSKEQMYDHGCNEKNAFNRSVPSLVNASLEAVLKDPNNPNFKYYKELNFNAQRCSMFNRYLGKYTQMGQLMTLRVWKNPGDVHLKGSGTDCVDFPCYQNFPALKEWINNLKIFNEIGRIIFWFNAPNEPHTIHRDTFVGHPDHFILINLHPENKDLFVLDDSDNKIIIPAKAFCFDVRNYHGTQGKDFYSWTLRIDGKFNEDWAKSIGIWDYFDPERA